MRRTPRVTFAIIGVMKGGTTALWHMLAARPEVVVARKKELDFWNRHPLRRAPAPIAARAYEAAFPTNGDVACVGEASPDYLFDPTAVSRLAGYNPAMRVIVMLRDPVMRAYAHWNHYNEKRRDPRPFAEAVEAELAAAAEVPGAGRGSAAPGNRGYLARSAYSGQLAHLFKTVPGAQVLLLKTEISRHQPEQAWRDTAAFLGLAADPLPERYRFHQRSYTQPIEANLRAALIRHFARDIDAVEAATGWDVSDWRDPSPPKVPVGRGVESTS